MLPPRFAEGPALSLPELVASPALPELGSRRCRGDKLLPFAEGDRAEELGSSSIIFRFLLGGGSSGLLSDSVALSSCGVVSIVSSSRLGPVYIVSSSSTVFSGFLEASGGGDGSLNADARVGGTGEARKVISFSKS